MNPHNIVRPAWSVPLAGAALFLFAGTCAAQSSEPAGNGLRFSGFGTIGVAHSSAPAGWGFRRTNEQPSSPRDTRFDIDSRLGVQLNYVANPQIELVTQLLVTRRETGTPAGDSFEWAFAAFRPTAELTVRAGRLNLDQFVMSDYRNVGFAYMYVRPPVDFYVTIPSNLDGADITRTWAVGDSHWRAKAFVGRSRTAAIPLEDAFGFSLSHEANGLLLRAGWSRAKLAYNSSKVAPLLDALDRIRALPIASVSAEADALHKVLDLAAKPIIYTTLGATYEHAQWQVAVEVARASVGITHATAGYASLGRRIGDITVFGMVSMANADDPVVETPAWGTTLARVIGPAAAKQAQLLGSTAAEAARRSTHQTTYSLGARWDIHPRLALKLQWDHVEVGAYGGFLWSKSTKDPGRANIATGVLDFVF